MAEESYGFSHSVEVIFTDGEDQFIGYLQTWDDDECEPSWVIKSSDGCAVDRVTHWMPLPSLPDNESEQLRSDVKRTAKILDSVTTDYPEIIIEAASRMEDSNGEA